MLVDDPDQDLNRLSKEMLAAGGGYFDRLIASGQDEVYVSSKAAYARVFVGTPTVVDPDKSGK
jgi:hypothetical protein